MTLVPLRRASTRQRQNSAAHALGHAPLASLARKSSTLDVVRLYAHTTKPWSFMFRIRFWPCPAECQTEHRRSASRRTMTARPIRPMSAVASVRWDAICCVLSLRDGGAEVS